MKPFYLFDKWIDLDHVVYISELRTEVPEYYIGKDLDDAVALHIGFMFKDEPLKYYLHVLKWKLYSPDEIRNTYNKLLEEWRK